MASVRQVPIEAACPDDISISDETRLYRRIHPKHFVRDSNTNQVRPSSAAFSNSTDGSPMSVALGDTLHELGRTPESVVEAYPNFALACLPARFPRTLNQTICRCPVAEEPAHGGVGGNKTPSVKRKLREAAAWHVPPSS